MSQDEQEAHFAKLLVEERRTQKKLACLASKCREVHLGLSALLEPLKLPSQANLPLLRSRFDEFFQENGSTNVVSLIHDTITTMERLETLRSDIKSIESGIDT